MTELFERSAADLLADLSTGALSAVELTESCLARIAATEPDIRAWAFFDPELALAQARAADAKRAAGEPLGQLHGLPVGVKDIIDTADMPTQYNSPLYKGRRPGRDATLVARLRAQGAVVVGKTVTSEFAVYTAGPTANPHDIARTPGGSSAGSAAAIAARMVPLALATQTNASTIRPASFCGVVGYKPSLGVLPRTGILRHAPMLDQPGLMAMDVAGVALLAEALTGFDPADEQSFRPALPPLAAELTSDAAPKFAVVRGPYWEKIDRSARQAFDAFAASLGDLAEPVDLPEPFGLTADILGTIMNTGVADACRSDYASSRSEMSKVLVGIVEAGQKVAALDLIAAFAARERLRTFFRQKFICYDAIVTPASLGIAPRREDGTGNPIMATTWTLLGAPAISLPLLTGDAGMPLGVQLVGRLDDDPGLIRAAAWLERHASRPTHI
jgi:Asp-tRNA(Asn)/Glu-tRNA(Gln) amidotransferase A subunit family amidase